MKNKDTSQIPNLTRRTFLTALATLPLMRIPSSNANSLVIPVQKSTTLVVYFSRSGNTRVIAELIHRSLQAELFEIIPEKAYPKDYLETVEQARQERENGVMPNFLYADTSFSQFETLYLGFPIWGTTIPPIVQSFLTHQHFKNNTIVPFITHGGYGLGSSIAVLEKLAPQTTLKTPFVLQADSERQTMEKVISWLQV